MTLLDLSSEHRGAFEYDWRTRFGCRFDLDDRGDWSWGELWRVTEILVSDPSSRVAVALGGWSHPVSREWLVLADGLDAFMAANSKPKRKPKRYPRPWPDRSKSRPRPTVTPEVAIAALRAAGHTAALPVRFRHYEEVKQP